MGIPNFTTPLEFDRDRSYPVTSEYRNPQRSRINRYPIESSVGTEAIPFEASQSPFDSRFSSMQAFPELISIESKSMDVWERLLSDQTRFYSQDNLLLLAGAFGIGAAFANTNLDATIQAHAQSSVLNASTDSWLESLHASKELGNGLYTVPIMGGLWFLNESVDGSPGLQLLGNWGERSLRGMIVGAVPLLVTQRLTGGSRPNEDSDGSQWHPFQDNNGVSGHAFMSSVPFITAAKMTDSIFGKAFWYSASFLGPLSRVNDNAHYPSQVGLGWALGFVAATAVSQSETDIRGWRLVPEPGLQSNGMSLEYRW